MNLFTRVTLLIISLIGFTSCNPLKDFSINDPREITFDVNNIKDGDFIIERSNSTLPVYRFIPKPGKTVAQIKIQGTLVWVKFDTSYVSDIWVYSDYSKNLSYAISVIDKSDCKNLINYLNFEKVVNKIGLIDFINYRLNLFMSIISFSKFDLNSKFDYRFHKAKTYISQDIAPKFVIVEPNKSNYFGAIYEGKTLVYKAEENKLVKKIMLVLKDDKKSLMALTLDSSYTQEVLFKYEGGKWIKVNRVEYNYMYDKQIPIGSYYELVKEEQKDNTIIDLLDIRPDSLSTETSLNFLNVPVIKIEMDQLSVIKMGLDSICFSGTKDVKVYLFRGVSSYDMMEIVNHLYVNKITRQLSTEKNPLKKLTRNFNYYYIRENNKWIRSSQKRFLNRFKMVAKVNLIGEINRLSEDDSVKNKRKIEMIKSVCRRLDEIKLLPDYETFETNIRDETLLKDGILKLNIPEPPESKPETKPQESSDPKPESKTVESSDSKPESKSENQKSSPTRMDSNLSYETNEKDSQLVSEEKDKTDEHVPELVSNKKDKKDKEHETHDIGETVFPESSEKLNPFESYENKPEPEPEQEPDNPEDLPIKVDISRSNSSDDHRSRELDISKYESTNHSVFKHKLSNDNYGPKLRKSKDFLSGKRTSKKPKKKAGFLSYSMMLTSVLFLISL